MAQNLGGLLHSFTATGADCRVRLHGAKHVFQFAGETSAGAGSVTFKLQVSAIDNPDFDATSGDDNGYWIDATPATTLTLSTTVVSDHVLLDAGWQHARVHVTAISGTDATLRVYHSAAR